MTLKQEEAWHILETNTRPMALESNEHGRRCRTGDQSRRQVLGHIDLMDHDKGFAFYLTFWTF